MLYLADATSWWRGSSSTVGTGGEDSVDVVSKHDPQRMIIQDTMQTTIDKRYADVQDVLGRYYDALYRGHSRDLAEVVHPEAHYFTASSGELLHLDMPTYFPVVDARTSPEASGESYGFVIDSIEFAGPLSAFARLRCTLLGKDFIDLLTLLHVNGRWQIVSKVFHFDEAL